MCQPVPAARDFRRPTCFVIADGGAPAVVSDSLIGAGCRDGTVMIHRTVLFSDVRIDGGAHIEQSLVLPQAQVGADVRLRRASQADMGTRTREGSGGAGPTHAGTPETRVQAIETRCA